MVIQRDRKTYAIAPHLPCGMVNPEMLRRIADVAEKFGATLKCTGAQRIAIIGLTESDVDQAWADLGQPGPGHMSGNRVRSVRSCPGNQFCKRGRQDSLALGLEFDTKYHGRRLPGKLKIGVSGCPNQCAETRIKDIGLVGEWGGWRVWVGGECGMFPRLGEELTTEDISTEKARLVVDQLIVYFEKNARSGERLGKLLDRVGITVLREVAGLPTPLGAVSQSPAVSERAGASHRVGGLNPVVALEPEGASEPPAASDRAGSKGRAGLPDRAGGKARAGATGRAGTGSRIAAKIRAGGKSRVGTSDR